MRTIRLMTAVFVLALAGAWLLTTTQARQPKSQAGTQVVTLTVPKMDCGGCEIAVKMTANKVAGVKAVKTDSATRTVEVSYDASQTSAEAIAAAITKGTGFETGTPTRDETAT